MSLIGLFFFFTIVYAAFSGKPSVKELNEN
jgi:hypothetical protein